MSLISVHEKDCIRLIGKPYTEVHLWLDEKAGEYPPEKFATYHRKFRHHLKGIVEAKDKFGSHGAVAVLIHIIRDKEGLRVDMDDVKKRLTNGIEKMEWED